MKIAEIPTAAEAMKQIRTNHVRESARDLDWLNQQFLERLARATQPCIMFSFDRAERHCQPELVRVWAVTMVKYGYQVKHGLNLGSLDYGQIEVRWSV